jgi:prophage antirepressor-like protein
MNNLTQFAFQENQVRVILLENVPWFVAMDLAQILEYADPSMMIKHVDDDDKQLVNPQKLGNVTITETFNSNTFRLSVVNESGLYDVIFGSTKPEAKIFKKWVTSEVLPTLRKTGQYTTKPKTSTEILVECAQALLHLEQAQQRLDDEQKLLATSIDTTNKKLEETNLALTFTDTKVTALHSEILSLRNVVTQIPVANDIQSKRNTLNEFMQHYGALLNAKNNVGGGDGYRKAWKVLSLKLRNSKYKFDLEMRMSKAKNSYSRQVASWKNSPKKSNKPDLLSRVDILEKQFMLDAALECCILISAEI